MFKKLLYTAATAIFLVGNWACSESFLDRPLQDAYTLENFFNAPEDLKSATAPLYTQVWFDFNNQSNFALGDALAGNIISYPSNRGFDSYSRMQVPASEEHLQTAWASFYRVIAQSNNVINSIGVYADNVDEEHRNAAIAEARFMRASAYLYLVKLWGPVIIYEDQASLISKKDQSPHRVEDVYEFIIRDLTFAAEHLPETDEPGRVTSWSAKGMLARAYLSRSGLNGDGQRDENDLAKAAQFALNVLTQSGLSLLEDYSQLFHYQNNNNRESLFSLQWLATSTHGANNTFQAYLAPSGSITGVGDGWGGAIHPSYDLVQLFLADRDEDVRLHSSFMLDGFHYPELMKNSGGYTFSGEKGGWKKYIIGSPSDTEGLVSRMSAPINTYMLRLAELHLIYADAVLGNQSSTADEQALKYFNEVRRRAGVKEVLSINRSTLIDEFRKEFAGESQFWYYLINWYYYDKEATLAYINGQRRIYNYAYSSSEGMRWSNPPQQVVLATEESMFLPYPESEVNQNAALNSDPVAYY